MFSSLFKWFVVCAGHNGNSHNFSRVREYPGGPRPFARDNDCFDRESAFDLGILKVEKPLPSQSKFNSEGGFRRG